MGDEMTSDSESESGESEESDFEEELEEDSVVKEMESDNSADDHVRVRSLENSDKLDSQDDLGSGSNRNLPRNDTDGTIHLT